MNINEKTKNRVIFSQKEWKEILVSDLIPDSTIKVLKMIYESPNHQNSCYGLAKKFGGHYSRFISPIGNVGKKIINSFKIKGLHGYEIFFKWHWDNENKFVWEMREELLFAMKELFYNGNIGKENKNKIIEKEDYQKILDQLNIHKSANNELESFEDFFLQEKQEEENIQNMSNEEIFKKASTAANIPEEKTYPIKIHKRNPYIAIYAKRRANGFCQLCGEKAPFLDKSQKPYLESHHIIWLSNGGKDTISNTVALCPNCHKKMHILNKQKDINKLKTKIATNKIEISSSKNKKF